MKKVMQVFSVLIIAVVVLFLALNINFKSTGNVVETVTSAGNTITTSYVYANGLVASADSDGTGTSISLDDRVLIAGFIEDGFKAPEIAELYEGKYSWQQIAAMKAWMSREGATAKDLFTLARPVILERDGYKCVICDVTNDSNKSERGHGLHVHHIDYDHGNNNERNMVSLCTSHHAQTNIVQTATEVTRQINEYILAIYNGNTNGNSEHSEA